MCKKRTQPPWGCEFRISTNPRQNACIGVNGVNFTSQQPLTKRVRQRRTRPSSTRRSMALFSRCIFSVDPPESG